MELDNILRDFNKREEEAGCYLCKVDGICVYGMIRFTLRNIYLQSKGYNFVEKYKTVKLGNIIWSFLVSTFQFAKLWFSGNSYPNMFYAFLRLDEVNGSYMDKFTDPIIDCCKLCDDFIIFDRGRRGEHLQPRLHKEKVIYTNLIDNLSEFKARLFYKSFVRNHKEEINRLISAMDIVMDGVPYNKYSLSKRLINNIYYVRFYDKLFKKIGVKKIFAPSRANIVKLTYAARMSGITVYEIQHGITYGETALYTGNRGIDFTPDFFLTFGDVEPKSVYGISEDKMINIGWAFQDFLNNNLPLSTVSTKDVLVISGPCLTDKILNATFRLANSFPETHFVVRPHPAEVITVANRQAVNKIHNVSFQDPKINIAVAMTPFSNVIGENSTVLYEAVAAGKKVARFCYDGFTPRYLTSDDEQCFWKVFDDTSFKSFIDGNVSEKKSMSIYSHFNKQLFLSIYNA